MRVLTYSGLFPSSARPGHGIFVETRLRELVRHGGQEVKVVAPVPWFFSTHARFGEYAAMARTPRREMRNGLDVLHPRFPLPPRVGMEMAPFLQALGSVRALSQLRREGFDFDIIDAHYFYPDGVAAALLATWFRKPLVITARGSDITLIPQHAIPRRLIRWAAHRADALVSVSRALGDALVDLGADAERLRVLRNGVDLSRFRPVPRRQARLELKWGEEPTLLFVANLNENKGHRFVIEALQTLREYRLVIVGKGPDRQALVETAARLGVSERVHFEGEVPHADLYRYFSAADVTVLASAREGWPNVLLESMACGTPVVATRIWGTPEIVRAPEAGRLAEERSAAGIAAAVRALMAAAPAPEKVRAYAEGFSWDATSAGQAEQFEMAVERYRTRGLPAGGRRPAARAPDA